MARQRPLGHETLRVQEILNRPDKNRLEEIAVWNKAWDRSQARGDQHSWSAWTADEAVRRYRQNHRKTKAASEAGD